MSETKIFKTTWGATLVEGGGARFRLWAPDRQEVKLELRGGPAHSLVRDVDGWFACEAEAAPGARYRFWLDDEMVVADPASRAQDGGVHGWSVLTEVAKLLQPGRCVT